MLRLLARTNLLTLLSAQICRFTPLLPWTPSQNNDTETLATRAGSVFFPFAAPKGVLYFRDTYRRLDPKGENSATIRGAEVGRVYWNYRDLLPSPTQSEAPPVCPPHPNRLAANTAPEKHPRHLAPIAGSGHSELQWRIRSGRLEVDFTSIVLIPCRPDFEGAIDSAAPPSCEHWMTPMTSRGHTTANGCHESLA